MNSPRLLRNIILFILIVGAGGWMFLHNYRIGIFAGPIYILIKLIWDLIENQVEKKKRRQN